MNKVHFSPIIASPQQSPLLTNNDIQFIESHSSLRRRAEIITWRSLLREKLVELGYAAESMYEIGYDANRAPYLIGGTIHFGVSHSRHIAAIIISKSRCAVDIEDYTRNFSVVARRFTTPEEIARLGDMEDERMILPIIWSAKETLYKVSRRSALDLITDLEVVAREGNQLSGRVCYIDKYDLQFTTHEGHIVVHTM